MNGIFRDLVNFQVEDLSAIEKFRSWHACAQLEVYFHDIFN